MARTLKSTGVASQVTMLIAVDDDNTTIKDFGPNSVAVTNSGITVTTSKTWKSTTLPMMTFTAGNYLQFGSATPHIVSPACIFIVIKDTNAADAQIWLEGSLTAAGAVDTTAAPFGIFGSNPSPVIRDQATGNLVALPSVTLANGDDWSCYFNSDTAWPNHTYFSLEANSVGSTGTAPNFDWNPGGTVFTLSGYAKRLGASGSPTLIGDVIAFGVLSGLISQSDAAAIHSDPFGTLFTSGSGPVTVAASGSASTGGIGTQAPGISIGL